MPPSKPQPKTRRRRSARVKLTIPVVLRGTLADGQSFEVDGQTEVVSKHGARVRIAPLPSPLRPGTRLTVTVKAARHFAGARVCWINPRDACDYGIELDAGDNSFWGVYFPPKDIDETAEEVAAAGGRKVMATVPSQLA
ncbi:MAG: PilZ domain-containing protein [Terriglobales bacterium]